jgi:hypothetical protein
MATQDRHFDFVVSGHSVASLVALKELQSKGCSVFWLRSPSPLGGVFWGRDYGQLCFDRGMMLIEPTSFAVNQSSDVTSYDPNRRNDVARFSKLVDTYLRSIGIDCKQVLTPKMRVFDKVVDDLIISNRVSSLQNLPVSVTETMRLELSKIASGFAANPALHASNKLNPSFDAVSFEAASIANHGKVFHEIFIASFADKLGFTDLGKVPAKYHRSLWLPLFYPETLQCGLTGDNAALDATFFSYPARGSFRGVIEKLRPLQKLHQADLADVKAIRKEVSDTRFIFNSGDITTRRVIWGDRLGELLNLAGMTDEKPSRGSMASFQIFYLTIPKSNLAYDFSTVFVLDQSSRIFRVTDQSSCSQEAGDLSRLCVEVKEGGADSIDLGAELLKLGFIRNKSEIALIGFENAQLPFPGFSEMASAKRILDKMQEYYPFTFLGHAAAPGTGSFNDQIVQGLSAAN